MSDDIDLPIRVAVVGSGPAGFYTTKSLLSQPRIPMTVDMFDRLPTPFGLVRAGVAPDHQKIKSVTRVFDKIASNPRFRFHGNVEVGRDLPAEALAQNFHAVVYAIGAGEGKTVGVPGDHLPGNLTAADFVAWYNGHPDRRELSVDVSHERAIVIGNGNVALDVTRMLALPIEELATTDMADHALVALSRSRIREILVLGRRGPAQASFTHPELLELGALTDCEIGVEPAGVVELARDAMAPDTAATLLQYAQRSPAGTRKKITLHFLTSPVEILGEGRVQSVRVAENEVDNATRSIRPSGLTNEIAAGLVIHAVGYKGTALPGLPFDPAAGVIPNIGGRVEGLPGHYVSGWIKRGPNGVIGTNKLCAAETAAAVVDDAVRGVLPQPPNVIAAAIPAAAIDYAGWQRIDAHERESGEQLGRPRAKLTCLDELVQVARTNPDGSP